METKFPSKDLINKIKVEKLTTEHLSVVSLSFDSGLKSPCQIIFYDMTDIYIFLI